MSLSKTDAVIERVYRQAVPEMSDLVYLLSLTEQNDIKRLFDFADNVRAQHCGGGVLFRGIIEFSNLCGRSCTYCGLNVHNRSIKRYSMNHAQILAAVESVVACGLKTVVLQSGESSEIDPEWLGELIEQIKMRYDIAITLCVGERSDREYALWRKAGADRYLLKIETTDEALYTSLHPGMSFRNRLRCLEALRDIGYQVGSGIIVGLKDQSCETIAGDILFFKQYKFDMIGIGPFIPHPVTALADERTGSAEMTCKTVALTRIVTKYAHLPATTALGSLDDDYRILALQAGANVLMPNFTHAEYRKLYEIYPGKRCIDEQPGACLACMQPVLENIGRFIDYSRGDAIGRVQEGSNV